LQSLALLGQGLLERSTLIPKGPLEQDVNEKINPQHAYRNENSERHIAISASADSCVNGASIRVVALKSPENFVRIS
jgi:hypothetical protein